MNLKFDAIKQPPRQPQYIAEQELLKNFKMPELLIESWVRHGMGHVSSENTGCLLPLTAYLIFETGKTLSRLWKISYQQKMSVSFYYF